LEQFKSKCYDSISSTVSLFYQRINWQAEMVFISSYTFQISNCAFLHQNISFSCCSLIFSDRWI